MAKIVKTIILEDKKEHYYIHFDLIEVETPENICSLRSKGVYSYHIDARVPYEYDQNFFNDFMSNCHCSRLEAEDAFFNLVRGMTKNPAHKNMEIEYFR